MHGLATNLGYTVTHKATLCVIDQSEVLVSLWNLDHVHEPRRVCRICAGLAIHLDQPLHENASNLLSCQGVPARRQRM